MICIAGCAEPGTSGGRWRGQAGKNTQARLLLAKGCENCPTSDDVWLENARVQANSDNAKAVLARGVAAIPNSIKIWLQVGSQQLWLYSVLSGRWRLPAFNMNGLWYVSTCMQSQRCSASASVQGSQGGCKGRRGAVLRGRQQGRRRRRQPRPACCGGRWRGCPTACGCGRPPWSWHPRTTRASCWWAAFLTPPPPAPTWDRTQGGRPCILLRTVSSGEAGAGRFGIWGLPHAQGPPACCQLSLTLEAHAGGPCCEAALLV